jgi:hypothetical protein
MERREGVVKELLVVEYGHDLPKLGLDK